MLIVCSNLQSHRSRHIPLCPLAVGIGGQGIGMCRAQPRIAITVKKAGMQRQR